MANPRAEPTCAQLLADMVSARDWVRAAPLYAELADRGLYRVAVVDAHPGCMEVTRLVAFAMHLRQLISRNRFALARATGSTVWTVEHDVDDDEAVPLHGHAPHLIRFATAEDRAAVLAGGRYSRTGPYTWADTRLRLYAEVYPKEARCS
jgi:hypothetical protein